MNLSWLYARTIFYPTLWWNMLLGRLLKIRRWWDQVDDHVILGAFPFAVDVARLAEQGVGAVVNTCEEYSGPTAEYEKHGITQLRIPTVDFTHPKLKDVEKAVHFMDDAVSQGKKVYVHCKAGRARSATVVICWLIKNKDISADEGQRLLNQFRPHINQRLPERPVVQQFESK